MRILVDKFQKIVKQSYDVLVLEEKKKLIIISDNLALEEEAKRIARQEGLSLQIKILTVKEFFGYRAFKDIFSAYSLKKSSSISKLSGFHQKILVTYSLKHLEHVKKTIFGYALKGRGKEKGLLGEIKGEVVGRNSIMIPKEKLAEITEFMKFWKTAFKTKELIETEEK